MIGAITRSDWTSAYQSVAERRRRRLVEAAARAADVPVREIVEERLERARSRDGQLRLERVGRVGDEPLRARDQPAVERLQLRPGPARGPRTSA